MPLPSDMMNKAIHRDDFMGIILPEQYYISKSLYAYHGPSDSPQTGGWWRMWCTGGQAYQNIRMRHGEDNTGASPDSPYNCKPWLAAKNVKAKCRIAINTTQFLGLTAGFVGDDDPANVASLIADQNTGYLWGLQTMKDNVGGTNATGIGMVPNSGYMDIEYDICATSVKARINNGQWFERANVPTCGLAWEFQLWNKPNAQSVWSQPTLWIDYLYIEQDR